MKTSVKLLAACASVLALSCSPKTTTFPADVAGSWQGEIDIQGRTLGVVVHFGPDGKSSMDILSSGSGETDAGTMSFPLTNVVLRPPRVAFDLPAGSDIAKFRGKIDGSKIDGSFDQAGHAGTFSLTKSGGQALPGNVAEGTPVTLRTPTGDLSGSLVLPAGDPPYPLVLIVAGSGDMDRNGNVADTGAVNDCLRLLASDLAGRGFASVRYDKRGVGDSEQALKPAMHLLFSNLIDDATAWVVQLRRDPRFSKVAVLGYSEGALVGMVAAKAASADAFISVVGPGASADVLLKEQLATQPAAIRDQAGRVIDSLKAGKPQLVVGKSLELLFGKEQQPFLISKFQYDPKAEIAKLAVPVLIIGGTNDLQTGPGEAEALHAANPRSYLDLVRGMNHVLRAVAADPQANLATYGNPSLPIDPEVVQTAAEFLRQALNVPPP